MNDYMELALLALERARKYGAEYADVRVVLRRTQNINTKNGDVEGVSESFNAGMGIRVLVNGSWGFAGNPDLKEPKIDKAAMRAVEIARASSLLQKEKVRLAPEEVYVDEWNSSYERDPFEVPLQEKVELLVKCTEAMLEGGLVSIAKATMDFFLEEKYFVSSEGSRIKQRILHSGAGISAVAVGEGEIQSRSYPGSFRGQHSACGYELIERLDLPGNCARIAEEAHALLSAPQCESMETTVILGKSQLALQVHESCGHPTELDRVLGMEANYAGTSFMTMDLLGKLQYGSEHVNIVADATCEGGLGTFGYDDEGVKAAKTPIIEKGLFVGYLTSRETASRLNARSGGTTRADGWNNIPLIRMTNINLLPGDVPLEEMIAETRDGLLLEDNRSWSIDDKRINFQFGTEIGWRIKNGRIVGMVKNPTYTGITTEFWNSCDAVADEKTWELWGTPNCGKGQPSQIMRVGHGVSHARFRNVKVGVGYDQ